MVIGWGIAIVLGMIAVAAFAFVLSRRIEHGEARFDSAGKPAEDKQPERGPAVAASRMDEKE